MNEKIEINKAIESGTKLILESKEFFTDNPVKLEMKIISFNKIEADLYHEIDVPEDIDDGTLWILNLDVINLNKKPINQSTVIYSLIVVDDDDYEYDSFCDSDLYYHSDFAKSVNLPRFTGWSDIQPLRPKIKANGSVLYLLPHEPNHYFLKAKENGTIRSRE
jgi:hypothetical protein